MNFSKTIQIALRLYISTALLHIIASSILFIVISLLYWWLAPIIFGMPFEEIALLTQKTEKIEVLAANPAFGFKIWLFMLLLDSILTPFSAGLYRNYAAITKGEPTSLNNVFAYFRSNYTANLLVYIFFLMAFKTIIAIVLGSLGLPAFSMATLVVISLLFSLTIPIIIFEDKPVLKAMGESYKRIIPFIFTVMLVVSSAFTISLSGFFAFGIGIVVTFPLLFATIFALYYQWQLKDK